MNFKKRVNDSWTDTPHYIHNTSTDTLTALPAVLYPNVTTATVGLKGNTVQSGTPTPDSPIMPQGCGERTGNLLNLNRTYSNSFTTDTTKWMNGAATLNNAGTVYAETEIIGDTIKVTSKNSGYGASFLIKASPNTTYTVSFETDKVSSGSWGGISDRDINGTVIDYSRIQGKSATFTTHDNCAFLNVCFRFPSADGTVTFSKIMLNSGSTALPYEPYGVKIPISSADTTTNNYLGEVETTRKIKKYEFTGQEDISLYKAAGFLGFQYLMSAMQNNMRDNGLCTHFIPQITGSSRTGDGITFGANNQYLYFTFSAATISAYSLTDVESISSFLRAQYANGTPVTIWYVLAEPTTGIVNEPLMRIGDYADTLSNVSIPVTAGGDTLSVDTTVQPSEVTITYKGWHPVADVHERDNGAWT